jgi:hypothetical protein
MENDRCLKCKNYLSELKCLAFDLIPNEILLDENDHSEPLKQQGNNIVFEAIENEI